MENNKEPQNSTSKANKNRSTNDSANKANKKQATNHSASKTNNKRSNGNSTNKANKKQSCDNSWLAGNNLEIIVAFLLLSGKLRVDAVQLFRQATMIVSLTGKYITLGDLNNTNVDNLLKFLNDNGSLTVDEIIEALKKKMGN
ncbi:hypothetical protein EDM56_14855 [Brevibacillus fluminis]|uniref:Uncharacterized protein n=1 Tax=Brevibacillus fluminis TaxID=511487 RepID=A0A3M8DG20_9BACL|nr:hypothetical protein [Brevibacillus fluminis]RNB86984.1 hypothetical protein EDM56_14855 [Brevibacillus fluminis]